MRVTRLLEDISYRLVGNLKNDTNVQAVVTEVEAVHGGAMLACTRTALRDLHYSAYAAYGAGCRVFLARRDLDLPRDAAVIIVPDVERTAGQLAARCLGHPGREMTVLGLCGTAGKTSVAYMLMTVLTHAGRRVGAITTDGVWKNGALLPAGNVVPDACRIQNILADLAAEGTEIVILELSAYQLAQKVAFSIPFSAVLLTTVANCKRELGIFESETAYRSAVLSLLDVKAPLLVLPAELSDLEKAHVLTFGARGNFSASEVRPTCDENGFGSHFCAQLPKGEKMQISLPVPGDFAIQNALATLALARFVDVPSQVIASGLAMAAPLGRMQCVGAYAGRHVYIDSAYEPEGLLRALALLRQRTEGRLSVLLGSVGDRAKWRRRALGAAACAGADFVYLTADDPGDEDVEQICLEMLEEADAARCVICTDRRRAIHRAVLELRPGDTLLLAGKGGSQTQLIHGKRMPFCEADIVKEALELF